MNNTDRTLLATALLADLKLTTARDLYNSEGLDFSDDDGPGVTFHSGESGAYTVVRVDLVDLNGASRSKFYVQTYTEVDMSWWSYTIELSKGH